MSQQSKRPELQKIFKDFMGFQFPIFVERPLGEKKRKPGKHRCGMDVKLEGELCKVTRKVRFVKSNYTDKEDYE